MASKSYRSRRVTTHLRQEKSAFVQAGAQQYLARLLNLSSTGALVTSLDAEFSETVGSHCDLFFGGAGTMVAVRSELIRVNGDHAAFKFLPSSRGKLEDIEWKIDRMASSGDASDPPVVHWQ